MVILLTWWALFTGRGGGRGGGRGFGGGRDGGGRDGGGREGGFGGGSKPEARNGDWDCPSYVVCQINVMVEIPSHSISQHYIFEMCDSLFPKELTTTPQYCDPMSKRM